MDTIKILEAAARRECQIHTSGDECAEKSCTGLWLPMLSKECPGEYPCNSDFSCYSHQEAMRYDGCNVCESTGRIPILDDPERLDAAAEALGFPYSLSWRGKNGEYWQLYYIDEPGHPGESRSGSSRIEARQAALGAFIQSVWPEVEQCNVSTTG